MGFIASDLNFGKTDKNFKFVLQKVIVPAGIVSFGPIDPGSRIETFFGIA
jgi:hypothetical protein